MKVRALGGKGHIDYLKKAGAACTAHTSVLCGYQDQKALMKSVKLLQVLSHHYNHLQGQPLQALVDILSEV